MVKKLFKSVHIYRSYRQNKPEGPFFGPHGIIFPNYDRNIVQWLLLYSECITDTPIFWYLYETKLVMNSF